MQGSKNHNFPFCIKNFTVGSLDADFSPLEIPEESKKVF